jgi:hypothetical protein
VSPPFAIPPVEADEPLAVLTATTPELPIWATKRCDWRTRDVEITGDEEVAARVLDAIHVV